MILITDKAYLQSKQYSTSANLSARMELHRRLTNHQPPATNYQLIDQNPIFAYTISEPLNILRLILWATSSFLSF